MTLSFNMSGHLHNSHLNTIQVGVGLRRMRKQITASISKQDHFSKHPGYSLALTRLEVTLPIRTISIRRLAPTVLTLGKNIPSLIITLKMPLHIYIFLSFNLVVLVVSIRVLRVSLVHLLVY